jgi:hypothetical protein
VLVVRGTQGGERPNKELLLRGLPAGLDLRPSLVREQRSTELASAPVRRVWRVGFVVVSLAT